MGDATERLVALAGKVHVGGHTRTSKSGKAVHVDAYWRSPGDMSDAELTDAYKKFWGPEASAAAKENGQTYTQRTNQYKAIMSEFRSRGLMTFKKGGVSQDNDPNHPSYEAKPFLPSKPKQQTAASKVVADTVAKSKGKRGARLADVAYALGVSNESAKKSIQHAIDSGLIENRSKGTAMSLFPKQQEQSSAVEKVMKKTNPEPAAAEPEEVEEWTSSKGIGYSVMKEQHNGQTKYWWASDYGDSSVGTGVGSFDTQAEALAAAKKDALKESGDSESSDSAKSKPETKTGTAKGVSPEVLKVVYAYGDYTKAVRSQAKNADKAKAKARAAIKELAVAHGFSLDLIDATVTDNNGNIWDLFRGLKKN